MNRHTIVRYRCCTKCHVNTTCHLAQIKVKTTKTACCIHGECIELLQDIDADGRQLAGLLLLLLCYHRRMLLLDANHMLLASVSCVSYHELSCYLCVCYLFRAQSRRISSRPSFKSINIPRDF